MKFTPGFTDFFLSPVTGRLSSYIQLPNLQEKYIWIGNENNLAFPYQTIFLSNLPNLTSGKVWIGNEENRPIESSFTPLSNYLPTGQVFVGVDNVATPSQMILLSNLPNLNFGLLWIGDSGDRPVAVQRIQSSNLPNIGECRIWRGDEDGNPISSPVLKESRFVLNNDNGADGCLENAQRLSNLVGPTNPQAILKTTYGFEVEEDGLISEAIPDVDYASVESVLFAQFTADEALLVATASAAAASAAAATATIALDRADDALEEIDNLTLASIASNKPNDGDVNINGYLLNNLLDPVSDQDAATKIYADSLVEGLPVTLEGFVEGGPAVGGVMETTIGPDCVLNAIPAEDDVSFGGFKLTDVGLPTAPTDGTNKGYVDSVVSGLPVTLEGFVEGGPAAGGVMETTRGPDCVLNVIPAEDNVSIYGHRVVDVDDPEEEFDAMNQSYFWRFMNGDIEVEWAA